MSLRTVFFGRGGGRHRALRGTNSGHRALRCEPLESRRLLSVAELVKDIAPGDFGSNPKFLTNVGGVLYFAADDLGAPYDGYELWRSDGTAAGTHLVKDIAPGSEGSNPRYLLNVGGLLYFTANDGAHGYELWRSDGTAPGTNLVKDISTGAGVSNPNQVTNVGGLAYFRADDGVNGIELWRSDGTSSGTFLVEDIRAGANGSNPYGLTNMGGVLYFRASDDVNGRELWRSDGTTAGTFLVKDINAGIAYSFPRWLTNVGGVLYFQANDGANGYELWRSDGTSSGTFLFKDIATGASNSNPQLLTNVGGVLYFPADDGVNGIELWRSDGTPSGTNLIKDIRIGAGGSNPDQLTNMGGVLYFPADDGVNGIELWRSDGTAPGTFLVKDIRPGGSNNSSYPRWLTDVMGVLYFRANDGLHGWELWRSDGTTSGTYLVQDIRPGSSNAYSVLLANVGGVLYFRAHDGVHGYELWKFTPDPRPTVGSVTLGSSTAVQPAYAVPTGSGEQLRTVPLANINRITLTFGADMVIAQGDLLVDSTGGPQAISGFSYDAMNRLATWTLAAPLPAGGFTLLLPDTVRDSAGNALDGEWDNPTDLNDSTSSTVSGDGVPGGDFVFQVTVLIGDANRNNTVTGADYTIWADLFDNAQGQADKTFAQGDFNGDGHITGADYTLWADHFGLDFRDSEDAGLLVDLREAIAAPGARIAVDGNRVNRSERNPEPMLAALRDAAQDRASIVVDPQPQRVHGLQPSSRTPRKLALAHDESLSQWEDERAIATAELLGVS